MATTFVRFGPFSQFQSTRAAMEQLFDTSFARGALPGSPADAPTTLALALDVSESAGDFVVTASVPGVDPADLDISIERDLLTIRGEAKPAASSEAGNFLRRELRWGAFERSLRLPPSVDADKAGAAFDHGILTLTLPKRAEAQPKIIKVALKPSPATAANAEAVATVA